MAYEDLVKKTGDIIRRRLNEDLTDAEAQEAIREMLLEDLVARTVERMCDDFYQAALEHGFDDVELFYLSCRAQGLDDEAIMSKVMGRKRFLGKPR